MNAASKHQKQEFDRSCYSSIIRCFLASINAFGLFVPKKEKKEPSMHQINTNHLCQNINTFVVTGITSSLTRKSQLHYIICNNKGVPDYLASV